MATDIALARTEREEKEQKTLGGYLVSGFAIFILTLVVMKIWPTAIPFGLFEFWRLQGSIPEILLASWPLFAWGFLINFIVLVRTKNHPELNRDAEIVLAAGFFISVRAGVFEEIIFRYFLFYGEIWGVQLTNWLFFGFLGFGIPELIYNLVVAPVANFFTLGLLELYLFNGFGWAVGAAIIGSNGKFRDGHIYQGWLGWVTAWFAGMLFFWLMFQYGIIASIIVHFVFDMFVFVMVYIDAAIERALGWTY